MSRFRDCVLIGAIARARQIAALSVLSAFPILSQLPAQVSTVRVVSVRAVNFGQPTLAPARSSSFPLDLFDKERLWDTRRALISSSGTILVANGREAQIVELGARGQVLRTIGRSGAGPGEFRRVGEFSLAVGDTLLVHDPVLQRITLFGPNRAYVRSVESSAQVRCCSRDGAFLSVESLAQGGVRQFDAGIAAFRAGRVLSVRRGTPLPHEPLFSGPSSRLRLVMSPRNGSNGTFSFGAVYQLPLHPLPLVAWIGDAVIYADGASFEFPMFHLDGGKTSFRFAMQPSPLDAAMIRANRDSMLRSVVDLDSRRALDEALDKVQWPASLPTADLILSDESGSLWIRSFSRTPAGGERWVGVRPSGDVVGVMHLPAGDDVLAFGKDVVLVRRRDKDTGFDHLQVLEFK